MDILNSTSFSDIQTLTEAEQLSLTNPEEGLIILQED